jgi:C_GCAxxG_C_C family probable redox protein
MEDDMMSKSEDSAEENLPSGISFRAKALLLESGNCAQTSFAILNEEHDLDGAQILKALTPFPGIALRGETCGAVIGSLMALGLVYGRDDLKDFKGFIGSLPPARRFCARFEELNGSTSCSAILQEKLGRAYNLADRVESMEYATSGGPDACAEVVVGAVEIASEGISKKRKSAE